MSCRKKITTFEVQHNVTRTRKSCLLASPQNCSAYSTSLLISYCTRLKLIDLPPLTLLHCVGVTSYGKWNSKHARVALWAIIKKIIFEGSHLSYIMLPVLKQGSAAADNPYDLSFLSSCIVVTYSNRFLSRSVGAIGPKHCGILLVVHRPVYT